MKAPTANLQTVIRAHKEREDRAIEAIIEEYSEGLVTERFMSMAREIYRQRLALCELLVDDPTEDLT